MCGFNCGSSCRGFWRGDTADFQNDGNMYRILRGGRGSVTAKRLECNRQNGGKLKIEAKKCFLLFLHEAVEIWQIM
jgi:phage gp45-like